MTLATNDTHETRLRRMGRLASELSELCRHNTDASRARSRRLALELVELFKTEDAHVHGVP